MRIDPAQGLRLAYEAVMVNDTQEVLKDARASARQHEARMLGIAEEKAVAAEGETLVVAEGAEGAMEDMIRIGDQTTTINHNYPPSPPAPPPAAPPVSQPPIASPAPPAATVAPPASLPIVPVLPPLPVPPAAAAAGISKWLTAAIAAAALAGGGGGALGLMALLKPAAIVAPVIAPVQAPAPATAPTQEFDIQWKVGPDGVWQHTITPVAPGK